MWDDDASEYRELFVNDNVFVWQRGPKTLFVVKSGRGYQPSIPLNISAMLPGTNACLMKNRGRGVRVVDSRQRCIVTCPLTVLHH